jgi:hypothetical protein
MLLIVFSLLKPLILLPKHFLARFCADTESICQGRKVELAVSTPLARFRIIPPICHLLGNGSLVISAKTLPSRFKVTAGFWIRFRSSLPCFKSGLRNEAQFSVKHV